MEFSKQDLNMIHTRIAMAFLDGISADAVLVGVEERIAIGITERMLFERAMMSDRAESLIKLLLDIELSRRVDENKDRVLSDFVDAMKRKKPDS